MGIRVASQSRHPLVGQKLETAGKEVLFQGALRADAPAFLQDHRIFDTVIFPAAGYAEMACAAGANVLGSERLSIEGLSIEQALMLPPGQAYIALSDKAWARTESADLPRFYADLKRDFASVKHLKPAASRPDSAELYVLATGFRHPPR